MLDLVLLALNRDRPQIWSRDAVDVAVGVPPVIRRIRFEILVGHTITLPYFFLRLWSVSMVRLLPKNVWGSPQPIFLLAVRSVSMDLALDQFDP